MISSMLNLHERPLQDINSCIENVSESIRKLHENCCSDLESDVLLAELKTEKLKALAATARTQALLAEMEMVRTAERLKDKIARAKLNCHSQQGGGCKCTTKRTLQKTPSKSSHKNQVKKLYFNKNNGKVHKPVKNKAKLFKNSKCNLLLSAEKNSEVNIAKSDSNVENYKIAEQSKLSVAKNLFASDNVTSNTHTASLNKGLVTAASLATYKPIRGYSTKNVITDNSTAIKSYNKNVPNYTSESAESFNMNVSKFFGSQASKPNVNIAKTVNLNACKTPGNAEKFKNVNTDILKASTSNIVGTVTMSNATNKNTRFVKSTHNILLEKEKQTTDKENKHHRYVQKQKHNNKKQKQEIKCIDRRTCIEKTSSKIAEHSRTGKGNRKSDVARMDIEYPKSSTSNNDKTGHHNSSHQKTSIIESSKTAKENMKSIVNNTTIDIDYPKSSTNKKVPLPNASINETFKIEPNNTMNETVTTDENIFLKALNKHTCKYEENDESAISEEPKKLNETLIAETDKEKATVVYDIFAKDLTFERIEIIDEPMDVDTDASFEETIENIHKEILKTNSA